MLSASIDGQWISTQTCCFFVSKGPDGYQLSDEYGNNYKIHNKTSVIADDRSQLVFISEEPTHKGAGKNEVSEVYFNGPDKCVSNDWCTMDDLKKEQITDKKRSLKRSMTEPIPRKKMKN